MANSNKWYLSTAKLCIKRYNGVKYCLQGTRAPSRRISLEYSTSRKLKVESLKKSRPTPTHGVGGESCGMNGGDGDGIIQPQGLVIKPFSFKTVSSG